MTDPDTAPAGTPDDLAADKLEQEVSIDDVGPARKKISIKVPESRINDKLDESLEQLQEEAAVPGFRRGRAPMRLIEKRFGSDVRSEVKSRIIAESYTQVVEDNDMKVIGEPDVKDADEIELPESGPMSFDIEVEVAPEFDLPDLSGLEVTRTRRPVTDDQVEAEIDRYREMQGKLQSVEDAVRENDFITADVIIRDDTGEVIEEKTDANIYMPGESRDYRGQISGILVADLGKQLDGAKAGQTVTVNTTGPDGHENEKIRGQAIAAEVAIKKVERVEPAPLEDMIQALGMDDEQQLRDQIRSHLEQRVEAEQQGDMQKQVTDAILEKVDIALPEGLSERQTERIHQRRAMELLYRGASAQDIDQNLAELRAESQAEAQRELKLYFILNKYAEKLEVEVSEGEVNGRIAQMAMQSGRRPEKMRQEMAQSGRLEQLFIQLREQKVIEKLLEDAKITEAAPDEQQPKDVGESG